MDGYHHYPRPTPPPPPPAADPCHQYLHQQPQPPHPCPPMPPHSQAAAPWYPNQFQYQSPPVPYHGPPQPHPPLPPPQQQQWPPYPAQHPQFPPPGHHYHHHHSHHEYPAPYPPQEWSSTNWSHQQTWNAQTQINAEEWAAKAKAWADAKAATNAMESQHARSQHAVVGENDQFHSQYQPAANSGYPVGHQQTQTGSGYHHHPLPPTPQHSRPFQLQEGAAVNFGASTFPLNGHVPFSAKDGSLNGASETHSQGPPSTNQRVHQQEVPSSYSSISGNENFLGNEGTIDHHEKSSAFPISVRESMHRLQPPRHVSGGPVSSELPFAYGNQLPEPTKDLADQPLQFAPGFSIQENFTRSGYAFHVDAAATTSTTTWTSTFAPERDPSASIPLFSTGHGAPPFGRVYGTSYPTTIQPGGGQFGLGVGAAEPPVSSFSIDAYGVSSGAERPKKDPVPNWLKEEIIKTKAVIPSMPLVNSKGETEIEDEEDDKSFKGDQADAKSIDSPKLTEDEDDDEDYVEAARSAAINQEIKRILTEILLKVTDEIFDEIAMKVLAEDDLEADGEANSVASDQPALKSSYAAPTPNFSERAPDSFRVEKLETDDTSKSGGNSPPNILGLAYSYASDADSRDGDELQSSGTPCTALGFVPQNSVYKERNNSARPAENGMSRSGVIEHLQSKKDSKSDPLLAVSVDSSKDNTSEGIVFNGGQAVEQPLSSSGGRARVQNNKVPGSNNTTESGAVHTEKDVTKMNPENQDNHTNLGVRDSLDRQNTRTSEKTEDGDDNQCSSGQCTDKEPGHLKVIASGKEERKNDGRGMQKEKKERRDLEEPKQEHLKSEEGQERYLPKERKSSGDYVQRSQKSIARDDDNRSARRQKDADKDRSAPELKNDSERYKRRHSSPDSRHGKSTKDSMTRARISSDEASDDSRRKSHSRKCTLSPSPVKSRRRKVSRSPLSKRSQRRRSPYSSVETNRGRRSRSKSPSRRPR